MLDLGFKPKLHQSHNGPRIQLPPNYLTLALTLFLLLLTIIFLALKNTFTFFFLHQFKIQKVQKRDVASFQTLQLLLQSNHSIVGFSVFVFVISIYFPTSYQRYLLLH